MDRRGRAHEQAHPVGEHEHAHREGEHGHSHGLVDRSILRSRAGIRAVSWSLGILILTSLAQAFIYSRTLSVALLADLIHNFGDALTAVPLGIAFYLRSTRGERWAGLAVVLAIFISALVALGQTIERFIHPRALSHLWLLAAAGVIGFVGNQIAAQVRLRAGRRLNSPALVADGQHARVDGYVSLGVVASAAVVALGLHIADPIVGLLITLVILRSRGTRGGRSRARIPASWSSCPSTNARAVCTGGVHLRAEKAELGIGAAGACRSVVTSTFRKRV